MEHEEYINLRSQLEQDFDGRYVKVSDCDSQMAQMDKLLNKDNVRLAVIEQQNKLILWVLAAVAGGIITMLVKMFFGG